MASRTLGGFNMFQLLLLLLVLPFSSALKFDIIAQHGHSAKNERCIRNFVNKDTLVVVTATVSGKKGDGQQVNMHVCHQRVRVTEYKWDM